MAERYQRCRFYPNCLIHNGDRPPSQLSADNYQEMIELWREGWTVSEIASYFKVKVDAIEAAMTRDRRKGKNNFPRRLPSTS